MGVSIFQMIFKFWNFLEYIISPTNLLGKTGYFHPLLKPFYTHISAHTSSNPPNIPYIIRSDGLNFCPEPISSPDTDMCLRIQKKTLKNQRFFCISTTPLKCTYKLHILRFIFVHSITQQIFEVYPLLR